MCADDKQSYRPAADPANPEDLWAKSPMNPKNRKKNEKIENYMALLEDCAK